MLSLRTPLICLESLTAKNEYSLSSVDTRRGRTEAYERVKVRVRALQD